MATYKKIKLVLFGLLVGLSIIVPDALLWAAHHLVGGMFEILEMLLDTLVEHVFHTDRYTTQIIVFYLMVSMGLFWGYRFFCRTKIRIQYWVENYPQWCEATKAKLHQLWHDLSMGKKVQFVSGCLGLLSVSYLML